MNPLSPIALLGGCLALAACAAELAANRAGASAPSPNTTGPANSSALVQSQTSQPEAIPQDIRNLLKQASDYRSQCQLSFSEATLTQALGLLEQRSGPNSPSLVPALESLSDVLHAQNKDAQAQTALLRRISLQTAQSKPESFQLQDAMHRLASISFALDDCPQAIRTMDQALGLASQWQADEANAAGALASLYHFCGDEPRALEVIQRHSIVEYQVPMAPGATSARLMPPEYVKEWTKAQAAPCKTSPAEDTAAVRPNAIQVIGGLRGQFKACFNEALKVDPSLGLSLRITADIGAEGQVTRAYVRTLSSVPEQLPTCLLQTTQSARFAPPQGGGAKVVIPISLIPVRANSR